MDLERIRANTQMSNSKISAARRNATRIMFILYFCHDQQKSTQLSFLPDEGAYYIDSETKLQKIDFWIRYPDHLKVQTSSLEASSSELNNLLHSLQQRAFKGEL